MTRCFSRRKRDPRETGITQKSEGDILTKDLLIRFDTSMNHNLTIFIGFTHHLYCTFPPFVVENVVEAEILEIEPKKADERLSFLVG